MKLRCLFFGHKYTVTQKFSPVARRIACTRCHRMFAMNDDVRALVDWSSQFHQMYELFGHQITYQPWEGTKP
jgi:hypothetical protein